MTRAIVPPEGRWSATATAVRDDRRERQGSQPKRNSKGRVLKYNRDFLDLRTSGVIHGILSYGLVAATALEVTASFHGARRRAAGGTEFRGTASPVIL